MKKEYIVIMLLIGTLLFNGCVSSRKEQDNEKITSNSAIQSNSEDAEKIINTFANYIQDSNYAEAIRFYQDIISGNYALESKALANILSYCEDTNTKALSGEYEESEVRTRLGLISKVAAGINLVSTNYLESVDKINDTLESKAAYLAGCDLETSGNYNDAIKQYRQVIEEDSNYTAAKQAIIRCSDNIKQDAIAKAKELAAKEDYIKAMTIIKEAQNIIENDAELSAKLLVYENSYINKVIANVDKLTDDKKFDEAESLLNQSMKNVTDSSKLEDKLKNVEYLKPVGLNTVFLIDSQNYKYEDSPFVDSFGNTYKDVYFYYDLYADPPSHSTHNLNGAYSKFTGSIVAASSTNPKWTYYVSIYLDDNEIFTRTGITKTTEKISFELDITNGKILEIRMGKENSMGAFNQEMGLVEALLWH